MKSLLAMSKSMMAAAMLVLAAISGAAAIAPPPGDVTPSMREAEPGVVLLQVKPDAFTSPSFHPSAGRTGLTDIDVLLEQIDAREIAAVFDLTINPTGKRAAGLDRIFKVKYAAEIAPQGAASILAASTALVYAEPNGTVRAMLTPNDPYYPYQWAHENTGQASHYGGGTCGTPGCDTKTPQAWDLQTGSTSLIVAVLDSGVDYTHPEFGGRIVDGYDFVNGDWDPWDDYGHGTCCAGILLAAGDNGEGIAGVAWGVRLMPIKVFAADGYGEWEWVADGIVWAADHGARILSMSIGGDDYSATVEAAVNYAYGMGRALFCAAGNDNSPSLSYPAAYSSCIAVGALSPCNERKNPSSCDGEDWWGSNYGTGLAFLAPGVRIHTTVMGGDYTATFNGTSAATPHAAGIGALVWSQNPSLTNSALRSILENSCDDLADIGWDAETGWGRMNAYVAVALVTPVAACCQGDVCTISTQFECTGLGGEWHSEYASCDPNPCMVRVCCIDGECSLTNEQECSGLGAEWHSEWISCDPNPCPPPVLAACCLEGQCTLLTERQCAGTDGEWHPEWDTCDPNPCPPMVCCAWGECLVVDEQTCTELDGYMELGPCDPNPCLQPDVYPCCVDETCQLMNERDCGIAGGSWLMQCASCDPTPCGSSDGIDQHADPSGIFPNCWYLSFLPPVGQGFTPTAAMHTGIWVRLTLYGSGGTPITLSIHEGDIYGPVVPGTTVELASASCGWNLFPLDPPVALQPGALYVMELSESLEQYCWVDCGYDCYPGGTATAYGWPLDDDLHFRTQVVREAACCQGDVCTISTEPECTGLGGEWHPEYASCDLDPCMVRVCCIDGECSLMNQQGCTGTGAEWHSEWTSCDPNPCPPPVLAACCLEGQCTLLTERQCAEADGEWNSEWSSCDPNPCPPPSLRACCLLGECTLLTQSDCAGTGGTWHEDWETCDPDPCLQGECGDYADSPEIVGSVDTPDWALGVAISGTHAYVADYHSGLQVIDISNAQSPQIVGSVVTPGDASYVAVSGTHAYIADNYAGLQVVDITDPQSPQIVGGVPTGGPINGVAVSGAYAYVADLQQGLFVIDVTDPQSPQIVGSVPMCYPYKLAVLGGYAYVADEACGLRVVDITDPASPQVVGSVGTPNQAMDVAVSGGYACVAAWTSGLQVIDVTNPANPRIVGSVDTPDIAYGVTVEGDYAYVADEHSGLQVIDISDPQSPQLMGSLDTPGLAAGVTVSWPNAYVADHTSGLQILPAQCESTSDLQDNHPVTSTTLLETYPNPGSGQTLIRLQTRADGPVRASVYDLTGRLVRKLFDKVLPLGVHELPWDERDDQGRAVPAGMYVVRVSADEKEITGRLMVIR